MSCQICGAAAGAGQFCVDCGQPLPALLASTATAVSTKERERPSRNPWLEFQEIRLLACPRCGAPNSAARWQCARCQHTFVHDASADELSAEITPAPDEAAPAPTESAPWVALISVVVGMAAVAVAVAMMASRGVGPFASSEDAAPVALVKPAEVEVRTSGSGPGGVGIHVADGKLETAWRTSGAGPDEWIELRLGSETRIDHLLVWNGDQRDPETFDSFNRVRSVLITFPDGGKSYTAEFPDRSGNFRVDMPDPPVARRIDIKVTGVHGSNDHAALTEVEALIAGEAPDG
ncbi:MAG TPA: discoidin domain-containing protein [Euzebyales bacterium]